MAEMLEKETIQPTQTTASGSEDVSAGEIVSATTHDEHHRAITRRLLWKLDIRQYQLLSLPPDLTSIPNTVLNIASYPSSSSSSSAHSSTGPTSATQRSTTWRRTWACRTCSLLRGWLCSTRCTFLRMANHLPDQQKRFVMRYSPLRLETTTAKSQATWSSKRSHRGYGSPS